MTDALRAVYRYWVLILFFAVVVQIGAAGYGVFYVDEKVGSGADSLTQKQFDHGFSLHNALGYLILFAAVLLFFFAQGLNLAPRVCSSRSPSRCSRASRSRSHSSARAPRRSACCTRSTHS